MVNVIAFLAYSGGDLNYSKSGIYMVESSLIIEWSGIQMVVRVAVWFQMVVWIADRYSDARK